VFISYIWLRELSGTKLNPQDVRERLTNVGLAVDAVQERDGDYVLDVEVPSNRPDCLSHFGIARELAVIEKSKVHSPEGKVVNCEGRTADFTAVEIRDADLCPRYAARIVRGVKIAPSPAWLAKRLEAIGQRPINNVADITNYVLHELGHPLHAFDLAKLSERRIVVRRAAPGEAITTLDGVRRTLDGEMLVIADAARPVAVAGVMGGEESEISSATADVLIESAYFKPASVRRTARVLGLHTEASHRFERGADCEAVVRAQERCVALICEIAGGIPTEETLDVYPQPRKLSVVSLRPERVEAVTGLRVDTPEIQRILGALGFVLCTPAASASLRENGNAVASGSRPPLTFAVPSWRVDVGIEVDLVEEIARHEGYDKIATAMPPASTAGEYQATEKRRRALRGALSAQGFDEAISLSFIDTSHDDEFELIPAFAGQADKQERFVTLQNPIVEGSSRVRPTLLPGLLAAVRHNLNHGTRDVCLFEIGRIFQGKQGELPVEREALALAASGGVNEANRAGVVRALDFYDLKGALEAAAQSMNVAELEFEPAEVRHLRKGQAAAIKIGGLRLGTIGSLTESAAPEYKFRETVFVAELDLTSVLDMPETPVFYSALPRFPSIWRDVSLLLDRQFTVAELLREVARQRIEECQTAKLVGTYEGEGIPEGKRSVTLRMEYQASDRTLRDEEVDEIHWRIVDALRARFAADVR
jgi:phenylalanyl-tRNA synthetase beta chain